MEREYTNKNADADTAKKKTKNDGKARLLNKTTYDRKLYGNDINVDDQVLLRNNSKRCGSGKLRFH